VEVTPVFGKKRFSVRLASVKALSFDPQKADIQEGRIVPEALTKYLGFLTEWVGDAINLELNRKVINLVFKDIRAVLKGKVLKDYSY
jgi:hypothetical protein